MNLIMEYLKLLNQILQTFLEECQRRNLAVDPSFAYNFVHLLARDTLFGLDPFKKSECKMYEFLNTLLHMYENPRNPTVNSMKLCFYFKNCKELKLDYLTEKYETKFKGELQKLIDYILRFPETSNKGQIDEMFLKMQEYIIASHSFGCIQSKVLLIQTSRGLKSVIGRSDLQNYVLKKKYQRLEYLQRLAATVAGILIYNNEGPEGDKTNFRNLVSDLHMALCKTKETFQNALNLASQYKNQALDTMEYILNINTERKSLMYFRPFEEVSYINKCTILFSLHERFLKELVDIFENTSYLISVSEKRMSCVVERINDTLKYRTAIESELIFPHFVYLSEVWSTMLQYLNLLAELNKIKEQLDIYIPKTLLEKFLAIVETAQDPDKRRKYSNETTFVELVERPIKEEVKGNLLKVGRYIKDYCTLTLGLTSGLVVPGRIQKKLCENANLKFGFRDMEHAKFAERHFEKYLQLFKNTIFTSIGLILLFDLEQDILKEDAEKQATESKKFKRQNRQTQTEMGRISGVYDPTPNKINSTWNVWDFHRETIRLAKLRKLQTHSTQTDLTYGRRTAQNQTNHTRQHFNM